MISRFLLLVVATLASVHTAWSFNFSISTLQGVTLTGATSLQFGPDNRLYVAQVNGQIKALTVQRTAPNTYQVTATETINLVRDIPNYDDSGIRNFTLTTRQVTGLLVVGTASNPIIYVTSSDPRIGGGSGGENDLNLDTNSGIISRLTKSSGTWSKVDLVRGLPRSEENHASNGMQLEPITNTLYLAQGGNTNAGGPSINFAYACETALSSAILSIDLNAINALPVKTDAYNQKYVYDLPTIDDPNPARGRNADNSNVNDPFGGNDGLNQAKLVPGGPVQIYAPGFRNPYDLLITRAPGREGRMYTFDNGANQGWGGYPMHEGSSGTVSNEYVDGETGAVNNLDNLHFIPARGYYGGHPDPIRANPTGAGWFHFDNTKPTGAQKIFSNSPTVDWPPVPPSLANPVEGDFRSPGPANGALLTNTASTNGLAEYIATNFSGGMQGNLIAASYDGRLLRIALSPDGTAVTNGLETLASGFGNLPLDVTTPDPGHGASFVGTIWVAHYSPAKISILEPADFDSPGSVTCTGINSFDVDEDGDGYSNADEIANNSDPCSGAIRPPDVDGDHISDLLDQDDDNDGIDDTQDPFPLDPQNGKSASMPVKYELFNDTGFGFSGVGLTGLMMNRGEDYLQRMSADNVIAGGTAGLFTIAQAGPGLALGSSNSQKDAYQFAVNSDEFTTPYVVTSRLSGPFFGHAATGSQRQGAYVGSGDQNNYVWIALHANGGAGGIEVVYEVGGTVVSQTMYPFSGLETNSTIDFTFTIDPLAATVQPGYRTENGTSIIPLGSAIHVTGDVMKSVMGANPLAVGLFASTSAGGTPTFSATWDYFEVAPLASTSIAKVTIDPSSTDMATSSTYTTGSFKIQNLSTGGQHIQSVTIDIGTAMLPDLVFDPNGTAGDAVAKAFQANSASTGVTLTSGGNTHPHNGVNGDDGYDEVDMSFSSFPVNGTFTFSIDIDPNNVKGVAQPGQNDSASVSGLELIGSTATVYFSDGSVQRTRVGRVESSVDGSYGWLRSDKPPKPGISFLGKSSPLKSGQAQETVRVTGPAGLKVSLVTIESGLYLGGVPGGGYKVSPFDSNTAIKVTEVAGTLPAAGYLDFTITPTKSDPDAGYNVITATLANASNIKGPASEALTLWYDPSFTGGDNQPPTAPDSLTSPNITSRSATLSWSAATDNTGVSGYDILRNGTLVSTTKGLSYTDIGLDGGVTYSYSVIARDEAGNVSTPATLSAATPANGTVVLRVNAGGPSFVDAKGNTWAADSGYNTGTTTTVTNAIDRAVDDTLFKTDRNDSSSTAPDLAYAFTLANGQYEVQLFFAELNASASAVGKRVFDVVIENQLAFDNMDIFALAGAPFTAVVASATTTVTDGQLNIAFARGVGNPKVNAIKVIKLPAGETVPPSTPANFAATNKTASSVTLAWSASTDNVGVTGYVVSRNGTTIQTTPNVSLTDTGLTASTTYNYTVRATDAAGNLSSPASLSVTTLSSSSDTQAPTAPGALTFTGVTASSINVNWTAATDNVAVTGYRISRNGTLLTTVTGLTYSDTGLTSSTAYTYSVAAIDAAGNVSTASTGTSTTTAGSGATTIRVNAGGPNYVDSAGHTWSADFGSNTGTTTTATATVTGTTDPQLYKTERYDAPATPALTYTFAVPNGSYTVRMYFAETYAATSGAGLRVFSIDLQGARVFQDVDIFVQAGGANKSLKLEAPVSVTGGQIKIGFINQVQNPKINAIEILPVATDSQAPTAPTSLASSNLTSTGVTLNWTASTDNTGVTGYRISRNGTLQNTVTTTTFTDSGLTPSTAYAYSVVAIDAANNASPAATLNVTTPAAADTQAPTAPGSLVFSNVSSNSVTLSWTAATDNVGVTGYRISRNGTYVTTASTLTFTDTPLSASTSYSYSVVAEDAASNRSPASTGTVSTTAGGTTSGAIRINAGGSSYTGSSGVTWAADTGFNGGAKATTTTAVSGTSDPTLFKTEHYTSSTTSPLTYTASVPNGNYLVRLHFAETYSGTKGIGKRIFDIDVQSTRAFEDDDIFALAGGGDKALVLEKSIGVTNGQVKISFIHQVQNPKINAIEIIPVTTIRVNTGGPSYVDASGNTWAADTGFNTGKLATSTTTVTGTADPTLFKTERYEDPTNPPLTYTFAVPNGNYRVRLHFAETYAKTQGTGLRVFSIDVQSVRAFTNVDIFAQAGGGNKALVLEKTASVVDGQLKVGFVRQVENPKINAIEIISGP